MQTLEGDVGKWFRAFPITSINSWDVLENTFMRKWGEKHDQLYYLNEFGSINDKNKNTLEEYNNIFNKVYNKVPVDIKPSQETAKLTYIGSFEPGFAMMLHERKSTTLPIMQDDAIYL